jgi:hypothetical protein
MLFAIATDVLALLSCVFAFVKGGRAERVGAAIIFANLIAYVIAETQFHLQVVNLVIDALTAAALLAVALRYASFWQGAVMVLYAAQFSLHAYYYVTERPRDLLHSVVNNTIFFVICGCLIIGTAVTWRRRVKTAEIAPQPAP